MDTSGFSQVGRYGTISLLKRNEERTVVTSFGIDSEELTFGRETTCGVRLYYPDVALLHCKVVFEERKAFLVVLGESGVLVDGCKVFPRTSNNLSTIIPLANNSEFEIHSKRFRFSYPPKEIRAALFATPAGPRNRALRLSMIHSAQVFSPHPSKDPRENLRILQSPLKNSFKSPVKASLDEEDQILLVEGNHPRVVQEERDLVILEDVVLAPPSPSKPQANIEPPRTPPRRKSLGGNALHRAVLIRSAQRAVLKAEKEREEEEEEMEVLGVVGADGDQYDNEREDIEDIEMTSPAEEDECDYLNEIEQPEGNIQKPMWRKSLEKIVWPFGGSEEDAQDTDEADDGGGIFEDDEDIGGPTTPTSMKLYSTNTGFRTDELEEEEEDENEVPAPLPSRTNPQYTPIRRTLGSFMTPQANSGPVPHASRAADAPVIGRFSLGGGEARRVVVRQPWRVRDLVIPPIVTTQPSSTQSPEKASNSTIQTPNRLHEVMTSPERTRTPMRTPARTTLTEDERKAIQERRRSALKETGPFFPGGVPGLTPAKPKSSNRSSSPIKLGSSGSYNSPMKGHIIYEEEDGEMKDKGIVQQDEEEEEENTRSLLERMKETVDEMKRRRSVALGITTPYADGLSPRPLFSPVMTPQRPLFQELREVVDSVEDKSAEVREQEPFSLLRPGTRDEVLSPLTSTMVEAEPSVEDSIPLPIVVVDPVDQVTPQMRDSPKIQEQPIRPKEGRSRLLRAPKSIDVTAGPSEPNVQEEQKEANPKPRSRSTGPATRRSRSRTPVPEQEEEKDEVARAEKPSTTTIDVPVAARRRARKVAAEPEEQQSMAIPPLPAGKRGRKAATDVALKRPEEGTEKPKGKASTVTVKQEQDGEQNFGEEAPLGTTTKGRATRAGGAKNGGRTTPTARTPAAKDEGRKTRTKTPATAPASTTFIGGDKDKENTPGSTGLGGGSGKLSPNMSGDGEDSEQIQTQAQGVAVKVRVSRSRGATASGERVEGATGKTRAGSAMATRSASKAVKVEVVEEAEAAVVQPVRVRRVRAKTKTG